MAILEDISNRELQAELSKLRAENAALKAGQGQGRALSCKVSEKGAVSVYGMGQWPVTLYRGQWDRLLAKESVVMINAFIKANEDRLSIKAPK